MSIKEKRQQRRKELYGKFVSVQGLIDCLADVESLGIEEVAAELEIAFFHNQAITNRPAYGYVDEPTISFVPYSDHDATEHLSGILSDSIAFCDHGNAADHHGWLRDDLFAFLQKNGIDVPDNLPVWSPRELTASPSLNGSAVPRITDKALGQKERNSLLCIIAGLIDQLGIDVDHPAPGTAKKIEGWVETAGATLSEEAIKQHLDKVPAAVQARSTYK